MPVLLTPGEIRHANNIGVLPIEEVNSGTVHLHLNAVVRNPARVCAEEPPAGERKTDARANLGRAKGKAPEKGPKQKQGGESRENEARRKAEDSAKPRKAKWTKSKRLRKKTRRREWAEPKSIEERAEEHCWEETGLQERKKLARAKPGALGPSARTGSQFERSSGELLAPRRRVFNRKNFTEKSQVQQRLDLIGLDNTLNFLYPQNKAQKKLYRNKGPGRRKRRWGKESQAAGASKGSFRRPTGPERRAETRRGGEEESGSASDVEKLDTYSIEPQESLSKKALERGGLQQQFYRQILSTMSIKSSNPIRSTLDRRVKAKKLKPNVSFREPFGKEAPRELGSNKSFKFSGKNSHRSKQDLFNISDNKSRLSNFSADLFPSNSNFTYDVNKIKTLRGKELFPEPAPESSKAKDGTRSQRKLADLGRDSPRAPRHFLKSEAGERSGEDSGGGGPSVVLNDNRQYQRVIYNTSRVAHQQLNIINMTLSVKTSTANQLKVSRDHHDSYTYSKHSAERWLYQRSRHPAPAPARGGPAAPLFPPRPAPGADLRGLGEEARGPGQALDEVDGEGALLFGPPAPGAGAQSAQQKEPQAQAGKARRAGQLRR